MITILYYAKLSMSRTSGVSVVVPQHLKAQTPYANIGFINLDAICPYIDKAIYQFDYKSNRTGDYSKLPVPFNKPDLVVFEDPFNSLKFAFIAWRLRKDRIPYLIVPHGCFKFTALRRHRLKKIIALNTVLRSFIHGAEAIQFLTEQERDNSKYNKFSIIVPNGIDTPPFYRKKSAHIKNIIFIGRKDIYLKGIDKLIEASSLAAEHLRKQNVHIYLYGPDWLGSFAKINELIWKYKVSDIIFNMDGVFDNEKENVLRQGQVFILTSRSEGLPVALLEAFAHGLPAIVTPGTNMAKEVEQFHCGWVTDFDAVKISEKLIHVVNNPNEVYIYSQNSWQFVKQHYNWNNIAKNTVEQYMTLINAYNCKQEL
ncbi:MAG: glycosyltransferase [Bacillota bacterium]